jgi:CheY-like chemotaxis protein
MEPRHETPTVAIINNSEDLIRMLSEMLRSAGYQVVSARLVDARAGRVNLVDFLREHDPDAVIFDLALPYGVNATTLAALKKDGLLHDQSTILTTPNRRAVESLARISNAYEITGAPDELPPLMELVHEAVRQGQIRKVSPPPTS